MSKKNLSFFWTSSPLKIVKICQSFRHSNIFIIAYIHFVYQAELYYIALILSIYTKNSIEKCFFIMIWCSTKQYSILTMKNSRYTIIYGLIIKYNVIMIVITILELDFLKEVAQYDPNSASSKRFLSNKIFSN